MSVKEFIFSRFQLFCYLVTLILIAEYLIGALSSPYQTLTNSALLGPVAAAGLCIIPTCITYFREKPTTKQYIFRLVLQLILIEGVMFKAVNPDAIDGVSAERMHVMVAVSTLVIYILVVLIMYYKNYLQSKVLTKELKSFQERECEAV